MILFECSIALQTPCYDITVPYAHAVPFGRSLYTVRQKKETNFLCASCLILDSNW